MKSTDKFVLVLVASLALLLAGCGGGSSTPATPPAPSGPSPAEMAIMDAKTALSTAQAGVSGASTDAAMLAAYRAVQAAASNLINVLAENGGSAADRDSALQALNNAASEIGRLEMVIADAAKANTAAISKLLAGLDGLTAYDSSSNARPATAANAPPGGRPDDSGSATTSPTFAAVHGKATTVTVRDTGTNPGEGANTKLAGAMGTTMAGANGWSGTMVTATDSTNDHTDTVVVYTNIEAPKSVAFGDVHTLTGGALPSTAVTAEANRKYIQASDFSTGHAPFIHGTDATNNGETIRISGSYAGAQGVYSCTEGGSANDCTSQGTNSGIQLVGAWEFQPNPNAMAMQTDSNYSYFGWWLRVDEDTGNYHPSTFHGHSPSGATNLDIQVALTGKATYSGPAVGKYAIAGLPNMGGHFTADASLSVDFEGTTVANTAGDVEGTVTNFMAGGTAMPWSVDFNNATTGLATDGTFNGTATWTIDGTASASGATNNAGLYRGKFQPNNGATTVAADNDNFPMSATGTWEVPFVAANSSEAIGHMIGAFGVTKDD